MNRRVWLRRGSEASWHVLTLPVNRYHSKGSVGYENCLCTCLATEGGKFRIHSQTDDGVCAW